MASGKWESVKEKLALIEAWFRDGLSERQIAEKLGISKETLMKYKHEHPELAAALKKGQEAVDAEIETALFKRASGYSVEVRKAYKCKHIEFDEETGRKIREFEELKTGYNEVHVPPDTKAQVFWLKNRLPKKWREKQEANPESKDDKEFRIVIDYND